MLDITQLMDHYRNIARSVWNTGFWSVKDLQNWDAWDRFERVKKILFTALVVAQLEDIGCGYIDATGLTPNYQVVPSGTGLIPIMICRPREGDRNRYWDEPVREVSSLDVQLRFLDYFDWNYMGYVDFQYYRVSIESFRSQPHLVGREALLEPQYARVVFKDDRTSKAGSGQ